MGLLMPAECVDTHRPEIPFPFQPRRDTFDHGDELVRPRGEILTGGSLLAAYSAGLGISFLTAGLAFERLSGLFGFVKRRRRWIVAGSALVLGSLGLVLVLNRMAWLAAVLGDALRAVGLDIIADLAEI